MARDPHENTPRDELATLLHQAHATIAELRQGPDLSRFAEDLRGALTRLGSAAQLAASLRHEELLQLIVRTAGQVLGARVAMAYMVDRDANELVLEVALGEPIEEARRRGTLPVDASGTVRVPLNQGIAGWVAMSGQPVARSDIAEDPHFSKATAERIGYMPKTTLCLPLRSGDNVIGVIQLFDKAGGEPFTPADMQLLDQFGAAAAIALDHARLVQNLARLFVVVLQDLLPDDSDAQGLRRSLETQAAAFAERFSQGEQYREAIEIAGLVGEISGHGPEARQLAQRILSGVADYTRDQATRHTAGGWRP